MDVARGSSMSGHFNSDTLGSWVHILSRDPRVGVDCHRLLRADCSWGGRCQPAVHTGPGQGTVLAKGSWGVQIMHTKDGTKAGLPEWGSLFKGKGVEHSLGEGMGTEKGLSWVCVTQQGLDENLCWTQGKEVLKTPSECGWWWFDSSVSSWD